MSAARELTVDVGPLFDDQWTGIPVFTRRLVQALLRDGRLEINFSFNQERVPANLVLAAITAGTGTSLRDEFSRRAPTGSNKIPRKTHLLFPTVKKTSGVTLHEASTLHDLSTLFMPENHEDANVAHHCEHLQEEFASNEVIFCASEATRAAAITAFPSVSAKTRVLYQYVEWPDEFSAFERNLPGLRIGRYAVVVGTIEPRKNLALILNGLSAREIARVDLKFVVIGRKGWLMDDFLADLTPPQRERVLLTGFVSEFTKYRLMKHSEFLIYPSLYEGFGIPALEAMSLGKPVLAARTSSFPEVIGDAGVFFDPLSVSEFAAGFAEIQNRRRLAELAPKAIAQCAQFGWRRMATPVVQWVCA
ncbi:MAG: glycosyltransferase family 4 protein [Steroidobacteraceae bacterium]